MICNFGTEKDCETLRCKVPQNVIAKLKYCIGVLNDAYEEERNYYSVGGYVAYADTYIDLRKLKETLLENSYEWKEIVEDYSIELHLLGDDFSIIICYPEHCNNQERCV